jgi:hypothetical protein
MGFPGGQILPRVVQVVFGMKPPEPMRGL